MHDSTSYSERWVQPMTSATWYHEEERDNPSHASGSAPNSFHISEDATVTVPLAIIGDLPFSFSVLSQGKTLEQISKVRRG